MNVGIVFSDMDGTFVATDKTIPTPNLEMLDRLYERGIEFVPCTGRPLAGLPKQLLEHRAVNYAVVANGAGIYDVKNNKPILKRPLGRKRTLDLYEKVKDLPITFDIFTKGSVYVEQARFDALDTFDVDPDNLRLIRSIRRPTDMLVPEIIDTYKEVDRITIMVKRVCDREKILEYIKSDPTLTWASSGMSNIEISDVSATKGQALLWLCESLNIDKKASVAFGDSLNDASMIIEAGRGVALANASSYIKEISDEVTVTNNEAGVAKVLERLLNS